MKRSGSSFLFAFALFAFTGPAFAQASPELAEELLHKNGMWDQLGDVSAQSIQGFRAAMENDAGGAQPKDRERASDLFTQAFDPSRMRKVALASVQGHLDSTSANALRAWYDSPLGKHITQLEVAQSSAPTSPEQRLKRGVDAYTKSSEARQAMLKRMVEVTHSADGMASILVQSLVGIRQGVLSVDPKSAGPSPSELAASLDARRPQIVQRYASASIATYASIYEPLSDGELRRYVDFLSSDAGAAFNLACLRAMGEALTDSSTELGRMMKSAGFKNGT